MTNTKENMTEVIAGIYFDVDNKPGTLVSTLFFDDGTYIRLKNRSIYACHQKQILYYTIFLTESQLRTKDTAKVVCTYNLINETGELPQNLKHLENVLLRILTNEEWSQMINIKK